MKRYLLLVMLSLMLVGCHETTNDMSLETDSNKQETITDVEKSEEVSVDVEKDDDESIDDVKESVDKNQTETNKQPPKKDEVIKKEPVKKEDKPADKKEEVIPPVTEVPSKPTNPPVEKPTPPKEEEVIETPVKKDSMAKDVMKKINDYRIENELQPLESTSYYQDKADAHALAMAEARALWHEDNGECITNHPDPFNAWINSPEHNKIILTPNNTQGVVSIYYVDGYYYSVFRTAW